MQFRPFTLVVARVVGVDGVIAHSIRCAGGRVVGLDVRPRRGDAVHDLDGAYVFPGLINAHDHLAHNHFGRVKYRDRYDNARHWAADLHDHPDLARGRQVSHRARVRFGVRKNLLAGTTTVCHHDPRPSARARFRLPIRLVDCGWAHSLALDDLSASWKRAARDKPWVVHLAEGTDDEAHKELDHLERIGALHPNTVAVHGVGLDAAGRERLAVRGRGLVWCPSSNAFLLGQTADLDGLEGRVALGTDARLTGSRDLLEELGIAAETGLADPPRLFRMVTADAAWLLGLRDVGALTPGKRADLFVLRGGGDPFQTLVSANRSDVLWVVLGGVPWVAAPQFCRLFRQLGRRSVSVSLDGRKRWIRPRLAQLRPEEPGLQ